MGSCQLSGAIQFVKHGHTQGFQNIGFFNIGACPQSALFFNHPAQGSFHGFSPPADALAALFDIHVGLPGLVHGPVLPEFLKAATQPLDQSAGNGDGTFQAVDRSLAARMVVSR